MAFFLFFFFLFLSFFQSFCMFGWSVCCLLFFLSLSLCLVDLFALIVILSVCPSLCFLFVVWFCPSVSCVIPLMLLLSFFSFFSFSLAFFVSVFFYVWFFMFGSSVYFCNCSLRCPLLRFFSWFVFVLLFSMCDSSDAPSPFFWLVFFLLISFFVWVFLIVSMRCFLFLF